MADADVQSHRLVPAFAAAGADLMAKSTAPILLTGGISFVNQWIGNGKPPQSEIRILLATAIAAGGLALVEEIPGMAPIAAGIAWIAFVTLMFTNVSGNSPVINIKKVTGI